MMKERIPMDQMEPRRVYRIHSRNLMIGVWNPATRGFIGIREKFGDEYLFTEYHYEADPHVGTVSPLEPLDMVPEDIELRENMPTVCSEHDRLVEFRSDPGVSTGKWYHLDDESVVDSKVDRPWGKTNNRLFALLEPLTRQAQEEYRIECERQDAEYASLKYKPLTKEESEKKDRSEAARAWVREQMEAGATYNDVREEFHARAKGEIE